MGKYPFKCISHLDDNVHLRVEYFPLASLQRFLGVQQRPAESMEFADFSIPLHENIVIWGCKILFNILSVIVKCYVPL